MIGSRRPWAMNTRVSRGTSGCQPSTVGMKPLKARIPAGAGRSGPSPSEYVITEPIEKPPKTVCSGFEPGPLPQLVVEARQPLVGGVERVVVGVADARHDVPVVARPARARAARAA